MEKEPEKLIVEKKIEALESASAEVEYLVEGSAVGAEGLVPCVLESEAEGKCSITIADGPDTGVSITVDKSHVKALNKDFFSDAASKLFK